MKKTLTLREIEAKKYPPGTLLAQTSVFPNAKDTRVERTCTLLEILEGIRDGKWSAIIARAREIYATGDDKCYRAFKPALRAFTVSGPLRTRAKSAGDNRLIAHSDLLQSDFDAAKNPGMVQSEARAKLQADPHVLAVFVGPSGAGIKAIIRIDGTQHKPSAIAAAVYFKASYGLVMDPACKDETRLCFVSHDPECWMREGLATVLPLPEPQKAAPPAKNGNGKTPPSNGKLPHPTIDEIQYALSHIKERPDHDRWLKIVSAIGSELPDDESISILKAWRAEEEPGEYQYKLQHRLKDIKIATLFHIAKEYGYDPRNGLKRKLNLKFNGAGSALATSPGDAPERPQILLPSKGREDSEFASEMADVIAPLHIWFRKATRVVAVRTMQHSEKVRSLGFYPMEAIEARTAVEDHLQTGVLPKPSEAQVFIPRTMTAECAAGMLASPQFKRKLPEIIRILDLQIPVLLKNGTVGLPKLGYDPRFLTYTDPNAPKLRRMELREALGWIYKTQRGFGFSNHQSVAHSIARLVTPACRGIMGWDARFPLWHFLGNRPRAGKDYLAGVPQLIYEGRTIEDSPLEQSAEETRKRITAALNSGRRMMHFANCQGHMQDACFCGAVTSKTFGARNLGSTDAASDLNLPNEIEFSMSSNIGMTFREDFEPRTRRISLKFSEDNANSREFPVPDLHGWVLANRTEILSAIVTLVFLWHEAGAPTGPTRFNSFPEWGNVVGGIMTLADLSDPCLPHIDDDLPMNPEQTAMRALFSAGYEQYPDQWIQKKAIYAIIEANSENEAFDWFSNTWKNKQSDIGETQRIGKALRRFKGRELDGITMRIDDSPSIAQRHRYQFTKVKGTPVTFLEDILPASLAIP